MLILKWDLAELSGVLLCGLLLHIFWEANILIEFREIERGDTAWIVTAYPVVMLRVI
jgi:hypothetical protein